MKVTHNNLEITSEFLNNKRFGNTKNSNNHKIVVKNVDTGLKSSFDFWGSIMDPEIKTEEELMCAFQSIVIDANAGEMCFDCFCSTFGYNEDSNEDYKTYLSCCKLAEKLEKVCSDISGLNEELEGILK